MKQLKLKGGKSFQITDDEFQKVISCALSKEPIILKRLNQLVLPFSIEDAGELDQSFIGYQIYSTPSRIFFRKKGNDWEYWRNEDQNDIKENVAYENRSISVKNDAVPQNITEYKKMYRKWVKAGNVSAKIIPIDEFLSLESSNNLGLLINEERVKMYKELFYLKTGEQKIETTKSIAKL